MKAMKTKWLDVLFSRFRWYRRFIGGTWTEVWDFPMMQGGFVVWVRGEALAKDWRRVIQTEHYPLC